MWPVVCAFKSYTGKDHIIGLVDDSLWRKFRHRAAWVITIPLLPAAGMALEACARDLAARYMHGMAVWAEISGSLFPC